MKELRKISEIASGGLKIGVDLILLIRELKDSFPSDQWKDAGVDKNCDIIRLMESDSDHILKGQAKGFCSLELIKKQEKEEKEIIDFYKEDVKKLCISLSKVDF